MTLSLMRIPTWFLIVFGSVFFTAFGTVYYTLNCPYYIHEVPPHLWWRDDFLIGQYFFNHDDDPKGPYDLTSAQFFYERALKENPQANKQLWYQSGRIDFINGDFDTALFKFNTQLELFGDQVPNVYYMRGLTYAYRARVIGSAEDWLLAEKDFLKAINFFSEAPWPYVDLAWIYFSQGKFTEMKPILEKGLSHESSNPWLLNMYGLALLNTNDRALALEYFLFAQEEAGKLTVEEWGKSYPGNDPALWGRGLEEFRYLISQNIDRSR